MFVVIGSDSGHSVLANIQTIIVDKNNGWLVVKLHKSIFQSHIGAYKVTETENYDQVVCPGNLKDYYPLTSYTMREAKVVVLKHSVDIHEEQLELP